MCMTKRNPMEAAGVMSEIEYDGVRLEQPPKPPIFDANPGADSSKFEAFEAFLRTRLGTSRRVGDMEVPIWSTYDLLHPGWRMALPALIMGTHLREPRFETYDEPMEYAMNDANGIPIIEDFAPKVGTVLHRHTYQTNIYLGKNPRHDSEAEAAGILEMTMDPALLERAQKACRLEPEQSSAVRLEHGVWMYAGLKDLALRDACMVLHLRAIYKARDFVNGLMSHSQLHAMQLSEQSEAFVADKSSATGKSMLAPHGHHGLSTASAIKWLASKPEQIPHLLYFHELDLYNVRDHVTRMMYILDPGMSFQRNDKKVRMEKADAAGDESEGEEAEGEEGPKDMEDEGTVVTVRKWKGQDADLRTLQVDKVDCPDPWKTPEEFHLGIFTALLEFSITPQWHQFRFPDENGVVGCHVQRILDLDAETSSDNMVDLKLIDLLVLKALSHFFDYATVAQNVVELGMPNVLAGASIHRTVAEWRKLHGQREAKSGARVTDAKGRKSVAPAKAQGAKTKSPLGEEYAAWNVSQCSTPEKKERALLLHRNALERLTQVHQRSCEERETRNLSLRLGHNARKRHWMEDLRNQTVAGVPVYKHMGAVISGAWRFPVLIAIARQIRDGMEYDHHTKDATAEEKQCLADARTSFSKLPEHIFTTVSGQTGYYPDPKLVKRHDDAWCDRAEEIVPQTLVLTHHDLKGKQSAIHAQEAVVWQATSNAKAARKKQAALRNPSEQQRRLVEEELALKLQTMQVEQRKAADMKSDLVQASEQLVREQEAEWQLKGRHRKRVGLTYTSTNSDREPDNIGTVTEQTLEKWEVDQPGAHPMCTLNHLMLGHLEPPTGGDVARLEAYYAQCRPLTAELNSVLVGSGIFALQPALYNRVLHRCVHVVKAFGGFADTVHDFLNMAMTHYDSGRNQLEREAQLDAFLAKYKTLSSDKEREKEDAMLQEAEKHRVQTELQATIDANRRTKEALRILVTKGLCDDRMAWDTAELNMINELKQEEGIAVTPPAPASQAGPSEVPVTAGVGVAATSAATQSMRGYRGKRPMQTHAPPQAKKQKPSGFYESDED